MVRQSHDGCKGEYMRDRDRGRKILGSMALYLEGKTPLDDE